MVSADLAGLKEQTYELWVPTEQKYNSHITLVLDTKLPVRNKTDIHKSIQLCKYRSTW